MSWTDDYLPPFIEARKLGFSEMKRMFTRVIFALKHSIRFHSSVQEPKKPLPEISNENMKFYDLSKEIYDESIQRIEKLEGKSFKLLSYYTILLGFLSFFVMKSNFSLLSKILFVLSSMFILWSIIISFRCLNLKSLTKIYLPDIYNFDHGQPVESFDEKKIVIARLNCAIKNDVIADNTAELHNAARYSLTIGLIVFLAVLVMSIIRGEFLNNTSDKSFIEEGKNIEMRLDNIQKVIENQNEILGHNLRELNSTLDSLSIQIDKNNEVTKMKQFITK